MYVKNLTFLLVLLLGLALPLSALENRTVKVGKQFILELKANPTTGYQWQLARPIDGKMLKFLGSKYYAERTGLVGSGGVERWAFKALKRGQTKVSFKYVRSWEKGVAPVDTRIYTISIN